MENAAQLVKLANLPHELRVAPQTCDDVLVMQKGLVVEYGPAREVLPNPRHPCTKNLIEAAPGRDWDFANFRALEYAPTFKGATA